MSRKGESRRSTCVTGRGRTHTSGDVYRLDRRCEPREALLEGDMIPASYTDHSGRMGITHITIVDRSLRGLGITTGTRIEPGMSLTICSPGSDLSWRTATAVGCTKDGLGFRVGLRLNPIRRAA